MSCNPEAKGFFKPDEFLKHPCFSEKAHHCYSRIHLPVALKCNIQCNYCNRKYDCSNESRPGVTSKLLSPEEALKRVAFVYSRFNDLSVAGIAGPGDALANPENTFDTFRLIREYFPDLMLCLSTNGLNLIKYMDKIVELGINHVSVTVNTLEPSTASKVYSWVRIGGKRSADKKNLQEFLIRQQMGIKALVKQKIKVKVNSLLMPGINDKELKTLSKKLKQMGVSLHNIMPLIAKSEHGTLFGKQKRPVPSHEQLKRVRTACGIIKQMTHCRQCRADAIGKLDDTRIDDNILIKESDAFDFSGSRPGKRILNLSTAC